MFRTTSSEDRPESQALRRQFDRLVQGIQDPGCVADSAFSDGLIPQSVHEEATNVNIPRMRRNRIVLQAVLSRVREEPRGFEVFVRILRKDRAYEHLARKLESTLSKIALLLSVAWFYSCNYMYLQSLVLVLRMLARLPCMVPFKLC